ncbi:tetratricopeptide repeat protein [Desulfuromonas versatilis]|nr:tetratricopeptide repeat protein [Desulfuromonas versatilis]
MPIAGILLLALLFAPLPVAHAGEAALESGHSFADALFAEGDYYRAITEYKRFLHHHPASPLAPGAALRIGECFVAGERWEQAEAALRQAARKYPDTPEAGSALELLAEIPYRRGQFELARQRFAELAEAAPNPARRQAARYRGAWSLIEQDRFAQARTELLGTDRPEATALAGELARAESLPRKSPRLAGGLSALLPGSGQLYVGRPRDAGLAFALNAAFLLGALEAFDNGNEVVGGILLFFEAGWYTGNIFNAANHAHRFNRDRREELKQELRGAYGVSLGRIGEVPALGISLKF